MKNERIFPILSKLAKKYLSFPATSIECERIFSKAGSLMNKKRQSLGERMVDTILFLGKNETQLGIRNAENEIRKNDDKID